MFICEVNETEINFELKLSKSARTLKGLILVKADFYKIKKRKKKTVVQEDQFTKR